VIHLLAVTLLLAPTLPTRPDAVGAPIPVALVGDLAGKSLELKTFRGKPLLINLWATWCRPCTRELPVLAEVARLYPGLQVVALSTEQDRVPVQRMAERLLLPFTVLYDPEEVVSNAFLALTIPATFVYDAEGHLLWHAARPLVGDDPELKAALDLALLPRLP